MFCSLTCTGFQLVPSGYSFVILLHITILAPSERWEIGSGRVSAVAAALFFQPAPLGKQEGGSFLWILPDLCELLVGFLKDADTAMPTAPRAFTFSG